MGFVIAKTALFLLLPPASPLILMGAGFLIVRSCRDCGKVLIATGFFLLYALSINPMADALLKPLESGFPSLHGRVKADAIVALGGGVTDLSWTDQPNEPSCSSLERVVGAVALYKRQRLPVVFLGGSGDPSRPELREAEAMARAAVNLGVGRRDIVTENKSRDTAENARLLKSLIKGDTIVLVTSAAHLKRASALFSKQGFHVVPAPCGYRYEQRTYTAFSFLPRAGALESSSAALHEYLAFLWLTLNRAI